MPAVSAGMDPTGGVMIVAAWLIWLVKAYAVAGAVVAAAFLLVGLDRTDAGARGAYTFRPLIVPGLVVIWPLVLWRWIALERGAK